MQVELRCYGTVRGRVGERIVRLDLPADATVGAALAALARSHDEVRGLLAGSEWQVDGAPVVVLLNGRHVRHLDGAATRLSDGDVLSLSSSAMPE